MNGEDERRLRQLRFSQEVSSSNEQDATYETGVTHNCEKHGDYPEKSFTICGRTIKVSHCMECVKEKDEKQKAEIAEIEERNRLQRERKSRELAGVSVRNERIRFKDFITDTAERKSVYDSVYNMAKGIHEGDQVPNLIITGKVGTGKTMLANCAINSLFKTKKVKLIRLQDMLRHIKGSYSKTADYSEEDAIDAFSSFDLLILDEVGVQRDTDLDKNLIFDVLDGRYQNMLPTMIISNLSIEGIKDILGDRVVDRLRDGGGKLIGCDWESFRK